MANYMRLVDELYWIHNARKAIIGLMQAAEEVHDPSQYVRLHHLGRLLQLLEDLEEPLFENLQSQPHTHK